jgi:Ca2+-binding RTX toxin-like protein
MRIYKNGYTTGRPILKTDTNKFHNAQLTQIILSQILNKNHLITQIGKMISKSLLWGIGLSGLVFLVVASTSLNSPNVYAANINCAGQIPNTFCIGSPNSDNMIGDDNPNSICGANGNDNIVLRGGSDVAYGNEGHDIINGGEGNDGIFGGGVLATGCMSGGGGDRLIGGPGDDKIFHDDNSNTLSDGFKDYIDCGPGKDEAWINTSVDNDIAINCEILHTG